MTCTIPVSGNENYKKAIRKLAHQRETSMAVLVRDALDKVYGDELSAILDSFFTKSDASLHHYTEYASPKTATS